VDVLRTVGDHDIVQRSSGTASTHAATFVQDHDVKSVVGEQSSGDRTGQTCSEDNDWLDRFARRSVGVGAVRVHVETTHVGA
jgi:hypothetical protein